MKSPELTRGRILFLLSIVVGFTLLTYNLISDILAGVPISISEQIIRYSALFGIWLVTWQTNVLWFRKLIGFGLGIIAIVWIITVLLGAGPWQGSDLDWVGVFCYIFFIFAISPDVDAYLKKGPNKAINSDS